MLAAEQLTAGDIVTGTVRSAAGTALVGVPVVLSSVNSQGVVAGTVKTGSGGTFTLTGAADGSSEVCADGSEHRTAAAPDGYTTACDTPAAVGVGGTVTGLALVVVQGGTVTGTVTTPLSNGAVTPLGGVAVSVSDAHVVTTDAQGSYTLTGVPPGEQAICLRAGGVTAGPSSTGYLDDCARDGFGDTNGVPVSVTAGATATANASLSPAAAIAGTVTGPDRAPVAGVRVDVNPESVAYQETYTAADGSYDLPGLDAPLSTDAVCFGTSMLPAPGDTGQCPSVTVTAGQTARVSPALALGGAIAGTVTDRAGQPILNADVYVQSRQGAFQVAVTDASGGYVLAGLPAAHDYLLCFQADNVRGPAGNGYLDACYGHTPSSSHTPVTVAAGSTTTADESLATGGSLSGTVTDAISGAPMATSTSGSTALPRTPRWSPRPTAGTPRSACRPAATRCAPPRPLPRGRGCWGYLDLCPSSASHRVAAGGHTSGADMALMRGGGISGRVTDAHGVGLAGVQVSASDQATNAAGSATTDPAGNFLVTELQTGSYDVCFDTSQVTGPAPTGYVDVCYGGQPGKDQNETAVTVTAGHAATALDTEVLTVGSAVAGTVTDATTGDAISNVSVLAGPAFANTDAAGRYVARGLLAGNTIDVCFLGTYAGGPSAPPYGYTDDCVPVRTRAAVTSTVDAALARAGAVAGTVTDTAGTALSGVSVTYTDPYQNTTETQTGSDGSYALSGVDPTAAGGTTQICLDGTYATDGTTTGFGMACVSATVTAGHLTPDVNVVLPPGTSRDGRAARS